MTTQPSISEQKSSDKNISGRNQGRFKNSLLRRLAYPIKRNVLPPARPLPPPPHFAPQCIKKIRNCVLEIHALPLMQGKVLTRLKSFPPVR
ncbi:hypothetical protein CDAR_245921 [Caerostris darwini]|uniref:Uncharacterized protein n=1 Tax=Caerostris darwini TaxID=1538125 RepID=A0AAV4VHA2_9ARAC|nr:hypothetical protein CDAR_245921 [Caerostris darwini]